MTRHVSAPSTFEAIRLQAVVNLRRVAFHEEYGPVFCKWQVEGEVDVAAYCNVNTYLETLDDLLEHGQWVDDVSMDDVLSDEAAERLFRFNGLVLLVVGEILADLRLMHQNAETKDKLGPAANHLLGFINEIWKHRGGSGTGKKLGRVFHRDIHHGPYYFGDAAGDVLPQVAGTLLSVNNLGVSSSDMSGVLVPSLITSTQILGEEIEKVGRCLDDPNCRQRLESVWGSPTREADE